jgi:hypothetical protein
MGLVYDPVATLSSFLGRNLDTHEIAALDEYPLEKKRLSTGIFPKPMVLSFVRRSQASITAGR